MIHTPNYGVCIGLDHHRTDDIPTPFIMSTLSVLASVNVAILLYFILIPISYVVGYVPTKKFKKEVHAYCTQQYNKYTQIPQSTKKNKNVLININTPNNWNRRFIKQNKNNEHSEYDDKDEYNYNIKSKEYDQDEKERLEMIQSMKNYNNRMSSNNSNNNFSVVVMSNRDDQPKAKNIKESISLRSGIGKPSKTVKL